MSTPLRSVELEEEAPSNMAATLPQDFPEKGDGIRFHFTSGSRPLDGYTIKRGIGTGGFGEVYYAVSDGGKDVAIKSIQRNLDIELRGVRQCLNIKHPNLLSLFDIKNDESGQAWVIMEYVAGQNLQSIIEQHPNGLPLDQVHILWDGITSGVAHLHDCGIVHRDLKPANIFLDGSIVKIGDYGLSKFISCSRRSGQTQSVGTFHYMAPEIGLGRYGKEIDIYALGVLLFELLTGRLPFDGESSQEIIMKHLTARPPVEQLPTPYREVVEKALAKAPDSRFSSVAEMRSFLSTSSNDRPNVKSIWQQLFPKHRESTPIFKPAPVAMNAGSPGPREKSTPDAPAFPMEYFQDYQRSGSPRVAPVPHAAGGFFHDMQRWFFTLPPLARGAIVFATVYLVFTNLRVSTTFLGTFCLAYLVYLIIESRRQPSNVNALPPQAPPIQPLADLHAKHFPKIEPPISKSKLHKKEREQIRQAYYDQLKPTSLQTIHHALGQMIIAALVAGLMAGLLLFWDQTRNPMSGVLHIPAYLWLAIVSSLATWTLLVIPIATKNQDPPTKATYFLAGAAVGLLSVMLSYITFTQTGMPPSLELFRFPSFGLQRNFSGNSPVWIHVLFFACLFALPNWLQQSDPCRKKRLSIGMVFASTAIAFAIHQFAPFQNGIYLAASTSLSLQLASPWLSSKQKVDLLNAEKSSC